MRANSSHFKLILQIGMGIDTRNEEYNTSVLAELSERGKLVCSCSLRLLLSSKLMITF